MKAKDYLGASTRNTQTPHVHNVHVRVPIELWKRFRSRFIHKGDANRVMVAALRMFLDDYEKRDKL